MKFQPSEAIVPAMPLNADISTALQLLEHIQHTIDASDDAKLQAQTSEDLNLLISVLENPILRSIVTIQDSLGELNQQLQQHPSILPVDFDITASGDLVLNVPPAVELYDPVFEPEYQNANEYEDQRVPVAKLSHSSSGDTSSPQLYKPEGSSLGFSVVGLRSEEKGELGIFVQEIQPNGIAGRDVWMCDYEPEA
ncbi:patj homolog isoform X2 [Anabrus simplex]|uniref:patj homolog isoform X2 n=1 Tax=Anabrus simplex TaxID=316456 RepID=UPI0035A2EA53